MPDPAEYTALYWTTGYADLFKAALDLIEDYVADGTPATASLMRRAFDDYTDELHVIARRTAQMVHEEIRSEEENTRVRPDSGGADGSVRLEEFIGVSHPLDAIPGAVGVNHEPTLRAEGLGWWWTNERGYSGNIGRWLVGTFQPGSISPAPGFTGTSAAQAWFKGGSTDDEPARGRGTPPSGEILEPIPARHFVEHAKARVSPRWHDQIRSARSKFMAELARISAMHDAELAKALARKRTGRP